MKAKAISLLVLVFMIALVSCAPPPSTDLFPDSGNAATNMERVASYGAVEVFKFYDDSELGHTYICYVAINTTNPTSSPAISCLP